MFLTLIPLVVLFLIGGVASFRLPRTARARILSGIVMTFLGLALFLAGTNGRFMDVDRLVDSQLAKYGHPAVLLGMAFAPGFLAVLARPTVHALTRQVQDVASGSVRRTTMMDAIALSVGLTVVLLILRLVVADLELWHLLTAGYILTLGLTFLSSELFGRLAFDDGGVAPEPMITTFVLAFAQGRAADNPGVNPVADRLGLISMVALAPPITIQLLGILFSAQARVRTNLRKPQEAPHENDASGKPGSQGNPDDQDSQNKPNPSTPEGK